MSGQELKMALLKRCESKMGGQGLPLLNMMISVQNIFILDVKSLLMLMGSSILIKTTRLQNMVFSLQSGHLNQNF